MHRHDYVIKMVRTTDTHLHNCFDDYVVCCEKSKAIYACLSVYFQRLSEAKYTESRFMFRRPLNAVSRRQCVGHAILSNAEVTMALVMRLISISISGI